MNRIQHIIEPQRLLLTWQAPENAEQRTRYIVAELIRNENHIILRYLHSSKDFNDARKYGFESHPAFPDFTKEYSSNVLESFMHRLPPRTRGDFPQILASLCISEEIGKQMSDFALLGYAHAKLPLDGFAIIHPFENVTGSCELLTEVAGARYYMENIKQLHEGQTVQLESEPENTHDNLAIRVVSEDKKIGNINRALLPAFHQWLQTQRQIQATIERINGQENRPIIYLFIQVR